MASEMKKAGAHLFRQMRLFGKIWCLAANYQKSWLFGLKTFMKKKSCHKVTFGCLRIRIGLNYTELIRLAWYHYPCLRTCSSDGVTFSLI